MLNRRWLPEGEHLRITSSSFSHIDLEGVEPRLIPDSSIYHSSASKTLISDFTYHKFCRLHFTEPLYIIVYAPMGTDDGCRQATPAAGHL